MVSQEHFLYWAVDGWAVDGSDWDHLVFNFDQKIWAVNIRNNELREIVDANPGGTPTAPYLFWYGFHADVSPNGSRIVYSTCEYQTSDSPPYDDPRLGVGYEIASISIDGTGRRRLTDNEYFESFPVWSPDGSRIAFIRGYGHHGHHGWSWSELFIMSSDGSDSSTVVAAPMSVALLPPVWSPDGEYLAFIVEDWDTDPNQLVLYTVSVQSSTVTRISGVGSRPKRHDVGSAPAWSPDGRHLAFAVYGEESAGIYVARPDGTDLRQIVDGLSGPPAWSPDGSEVLFVSDGVYVVGSDGSDLRRLDVYFPIVVPDRAVWSPDGSRIAVLGNIRKGYVRRVLFTMQRNGEEKRILVVGDVEMYHPVVSLYGDLHALTPFWPKSAIDLTACSRAPAVLPIEANPGLVRDCEVLLDIRDMLAGTAGLNWNPSTNIGGWAGVTVGGSPPRVLELSLRGRGLTGTIPPEISKLTKLRKLDLSSNYLSGGIAPELGGLVNLQELNLVDNLLTGNIPPEMGGLEELTELYIRYNGFSGCISAELPELWAKQSELERCEPEEATTAAP